MKKEILEREAATDGLAAAPADGETDGVASYSPPSSNRGVTGGVQNPKTPVHSKNPLNVTKPTSWTAKATC